MEFQAKKAVLTQYFVAAEPANTRSYDIRTTEFILNPWYKFTGEQVATSICAGKAIVTLMRNYAP